jgi:predicted ATP-dependent Lon-type protease
VSLLILADTSCTERDIAGYNRIHTAIRPNLEVSKVRDLFAINHYGSKSAYKFNADDMHERSLRVISEGNGASSSAKRRNLAALLRKIMS